MICSLSNTHHLISDEKLLLNFIIIICKGCFHEIHPKLNILYMIFNNWRFYTYFFTIFLFYILLVCLYDVEFFFTKLTVGNFFKNKNWKNNIVLYINSKYNKTIVLNVPVQQTHKSGNIQFLLWCHLFVFVI